MNWSKGSNGLLKFRVFDRVKSVKITSKNMKLKSSK